MTADTGQSPETRASQSSVGDLISEVSQDVTTLLRQEVELAKAELRQDVHKVGKGTGMLAGAAQAAVFVLLFLSIALWWAIGSAIGLGWSALVVAAVWLIAAAALAVMGRTEMRTIRGVPRTAETVKKIPAAMKGQEDS